MLIEGNVLPNDLINTHFEEDFVKGIEVGKLVVEVEHL